MGSFIPTLEQVATISKYPTMESVPENERRYKCVVCYTISDYKTCPVCGEEGSGNQQMCPLDHCNCPHDIVEDIAYCPICAKPICPECGTHDVSQVSRVTGYLSDVAGWNASKQQELKDRHRVTDVEQVRMP